MPDKKETIKSCWLNGSAKLGGPYCFIDDGEHYASWFWELHPEGSTYWYYDFQDSFYEIEGMRIPLTTRWILCPEHEHFAKEEQTGE